MRTIYVTPSPNGDTRTAKDTSFKAFNQDITSHKQDVSNVMNAIAEEVIEVGVNHDYTKITNEELFYKDFVSTIQNNDNFLDKEWWQIHLQERHHLNHRVPEDVNFIDIIEMIVDMMTAGKARSGKVYPINLEDNILRKAFENTIKLIDEHTKRN